MKRRAVTANVANSYCPQYGPYVDNDGQFILDNDWSRSACLLNVRVKIDTRIVTSLVAGTKEDQVV